MKDKWIKKKTITKIIDGEEVVFRKVPVGVFLKCRGLNDEVSKFLSMCFKDTSKDAKFEQMTDANGNSNYSQEAAEAQIIDMRKMQMENGIKGLLNAVTSEGTMELLSEIVVKSATEEFDESDIPTLRDNLGIDQMIEFLKGAFEASAGDYAKLGKSLLQKNPQAQEILGKLKTGQEEAQDS